MDTLSLNELIKSQRSDAMGWDKASSDGLSKTRTIYSKNTTHIYYPKIQSENQSNQHMEDAELIAKYIEDVGVTRCKASTKKPQTFRPKGVADKRTYGAGLNGNRRSR